MYLRRNTQFNFMYISALLLHPITAAALLRNIFKKKMNWLKSGKIHYVLQKILDKHCLIQQTDLTTSPLKYPSEHSYQFKTCLWFDKIPIYIMAHNSGTETIFDCKTN